LRASGSASPGRVKDLPISRVYWNQLKASVEKFKHENAESERGRSSDDEL
jgi:hypothetical protein